MEPDPKGLQYGSNPYVYCENNPVNMVDVTGENPFVVGGLIGFATYAGPLAYHAMQNSNSVGQFAHNFGSQFSFGAAITSTAAGAVTGGVSTSILEASGLALNSSKFLFPEIAPMPFAPGSFLANTLSKFPTQIEALGIKLNPQNMIANQARVWTNPAGIGVKVAASQAATAANAAYTSTVNTTISSRPPAINGTEGITSYLNQNVYGNYQRGNPVGFGCGDYCTTINVTTGQIY